MTSERVKQLVDAADGLKLALIRSMGARPMLDALAGDVALTLSALPAEERAEALAWFLASIAEQVERKAAAA